MAMTKGMCTKVTGAVLTLQVPKFQARELLFKRLRKNSLSFGAPFSAPRFHGGYPANGQQSRL